MHAGNGTTATLERWTAAKGPAARFVAERYLAWGSRADGLIIVIGEIDGAIWTAQAGFRDAIDMGSDLSLVRHRADGRVEAFPLVTVREWMDAYDAASGRDHDDRAAQTRDQVKRLVLARLWQLAAPKGPWPVTRSQQPARIEGNPFDPENDDPQRAGSWLVEVRSAKGTRFRYLLEGKTSMCWTDYDWRWYVL